MACALLCAWELDTDVLLCVLARCPCLARPSGSCRHNALDVDREGRIQVLDFVEVHRPAVYVAPARGPTHRFLGTAAP